MNDDAAGLPGPLLAHTGPILARERPRQGGFFDVTLLDAARGRFVLKQGDTPPAVAELAAESRVLDALAPYRPLVARPIAHVIEEDESGTGWFLFSCLPGQDLAHALWEPGSTPARRHGLIAAFGNLLRQIHDGWMPTGDLPRREDWLSWAVGAARANVVAGRVEVASSGAWSLGGRDPAEVVSEMEAERSRLQNEIAFGHGDYCLPNVLAVGETVSGVIDWSRGGWADRRFDIATGLRTIRYNLQDLNEEDPGDVATYLNTFLTAYGYEGPPESLRFFEALYVLL